MTQIKHKIFSRREMMRIYGRPIKKQHYTDTVQSEKYCCPTPKYSRMCLFSAPPPSLLLLQHRVCDSSGFLIGLFWFYFISWFWEFWWIVFIVGTFYLYVYFCSFFFSVIYTPTRPAAGRYLRPRAHHTNPSSKCLKCWQTSVKSSSALL